MADIPAPLGSAFGVDKPAAAEEPLLSEFDAEAKARMRAIEAQVNADVHAQSESHYYVCVVFHSEAARREWLEKALGETEDLRFVSGADVARACGVEIESPPPKLRDPRPSRRLLDLAAPLTSLPSAPRPGKSG